VIRDPRLYLGEDAFRSARLVQDGVLRRLQIIGEAAKRLPAELREKYGSVPWRQMAATRDVVVHDYSGLDLGLTWIVATRELPSVKPQIPQILVDLGRETE
jgi:uncharacterized protein with HEPN domain